MTVMIDVHIQWRIARCRWIQMVRHLSTHFSQLHLRCIYESRHQMLYSITLIVMLETYINAKWKPQIGKVTTLYDSYTLLYVQLDNFLNVKIVFVLFQLISTDILPKRFWTLYPLLRQLIGQRTSYICIYFVVFI